MIYASYHFFFWFCNAHLLYSFSMRNNKKKLKTHISLKLYVKDSKPVSKSYIPKLESFQNHPEANWIFEIGQKCLVFKMQRNFWIHPSDSYIFHSYLLSSLMNNSNKIYDYITGLYNRQKRTPPKTCVIVGGVEFTQVCTAIISRRCLDTALRDSRLLDMIQFVCDFLF